MPGVLTYSGSDERRGLAQLGFPVDIIRLQKSW